MNPAKRIFLIHATRIAIDPIGAAFAQDWPEAQCFDLWDDSLSKDAGKAGGSTPALDQRIQDLAGHAFRADADAVLFTCSAFSSGIEACQRRYDRPVLKPNEAMVREALAHGGRIAALTTFGPAGAAIVSDFEGEARRLGQAVDITPILCEGALSALHAGDQASHDAVIAAAAERLRGDYQVLCFAQFSMTSAKTASEAAWGDAVLTTPTSAVAELRRLLES
ncbi:aspartate/glutamate racemase family protein [Pseudomonas oryzihabitans]|uniref:Arylsulfatase n=1 Tax=Pseudomonas oryzihabitans TaxID=47885 RepID=A0A2Z5A7T4_9PSED|nr:aspartate/glutamate racemase family protein [Pseudomonas oryzihabitans]AXA66835.1 arylsulfatase [Pseudomonas oryzihabitans]